MNWMRYLSTEKGRSSGCLWFEREKKEYKEKKEKIEKEYLVAGVHAGSVPKGKEYNEGVFLTIGKLNQINNSIKNFEDDKDNEINKLIKDDPSLQYELGNYYYGLGEENSNSENYKKAVLWYTLAANNEKYTTDSVHARVLSWPVL